jgi:hypothetical protein
MTAEEAEREAQAVKALIVAAGTGAHPWSVEELDRVLAHVAGAGFDPAGLERARGNIVGLERPAGGRVQRGDRLPPAEVHYLRHVIARQEWPVGTTLDAYLVSLRRVIGDAASGVFVSRYLGAWQLGVIGHSLGARGPGGGRWILVDYRVEIGHWTTAYQPERPLKRAIYTPSREAIQWIRLPRRLSRRTATS